MSDLVLKEEIDEIRKRIVVISYEDVLTGKALLIRLDKFTTKSGYDICITAEHLQNVSIEHIFISNRSKETDIATFDCVARDIFGADYKYVGSFNNIVYNYIRLVSGDKERFDAFIEFMKTAARLR